MKHILLSLISTIILTCSSIMLAHDFTQNESLEVRQHFFSFSRTFSIVGKKIDAQNNIQKDFYGTIRRKYFTFNWVYNFENIDGEVIGKAVSDWSIERLVLGKLRFKIYDKNNDGNLLGFIEEKYSLLYNLFTLSSYHEYIIRDKTEKILLKTKMNLWGTTMTLTTIDNTIVGTLHRPFFAPFRDFWTLNITDKKTFESLNLDPLFLLYLGAIQTDHQKYLRSIRYHNSHHHYNNSNDSSESK